MDTDSFSIAPPAPILIPTQRSWPSTRMLEKRILENEEKLYVAIDVLHKTIDALAKYMESKE